MGDTGRTTTGTEGSAVDHTTTHIAPLGAATSGDSRLRPRHARHRRQPGRGVTGAVMSALLVACALAGVSALPTPGDPAALSALETRTVRVAASDTLWAIARANPVDGQPTARTVETIRRMNSLAGSLLTPGSVLRVPAPRATDARFAGQAPRFE
jgi:nucleoid-associated protein YgaU